MIALRLSRKPNIFDLSQSDGDGRLDHRALFGLDCCLFCLNAVAFPHSFEPAAVADGTACCEFRSMAELAVPLSVTTLNASSMVVSGALGHFPCFCFQMVRTEKINRPLIANDGAVCACAEIRLEPARTATITTKTTRRRNLFWQVFIRNHLVNSCGRRWNIPARQRSKTGGK